MCDCTLCRDGIRHILCDLYGYYEAIARGAVVESEERRLDLVADCRAEIEVDWNLARFGRWTRHEKGAAE